MALSDSEDHLVEFLLNLLIHEAEVLNPGGFVPKSARFLARVPLSCSEKHSNVVPSAERTSEPLITSRSPRGISAKFARSMTSSPSPWSRSAASPHCGISSLRI
jgi:hypothetical protein